MASNLLIADYIRAFPQSRLGGLGQVDPWTLTGRADEIVRGLLASLSGDDFVVDGITAVHRSATVETGAVLKGPLVLGARCFVAAGAYLRGGNWLDEDCVVGPGSELKSSFVFARTKLAHFNFVGDSIVGSDVNFEAGSIVCNFRNERSKPEIRVRVGGSMRRTGVEKFGALIGDAARLGANSVLAPGAILRAGTVVGRASLVEQDPVMFP